ncbi:HNH endonuclease [Isoptericola sp. BMS4]|uniref:HNH endonuclease n=1 Tax=Isoptericola sp. BMS4 TaxID=2527875 RepID=UPI00196B9AF0|nr:HNH endonuclease [Isoptericola sp. BMS4]
MILTTRDPDMHWDLTAADYASLDDATTAGMPWKLGAPRRALSNRSRAGTYYWLVNLEKVYAVNDADLIPQDVLALLNEKANGRRLQLEKAHALQAMATELDRKARREPIPQDVKITIWQRDGGRCVECSSNQDLEFDHIIPLALGGSNTMRNLQLLCAVCNGRKGATLG